MRSYCIRLLEVTVITVLMAGCLEEEQSPNGTFSKKTPLYHGVPICVFQNTSNKNLSVANVKLFGGQKYGTVNNFRLNKSSIAEGAEATPANTVTSTGVSVHPKLLPELAPQFQGLVAGSDILTLGHGGGNLILDFAQVYKDKFPLEIKPGEQLDMGLYESRLADDFEGSCQFDWDDK